MRVFVDENLSPDLVSVAHRGGYDATCARDRDLLGRIDPQVLELCLNEDRVCVTNNADDFEELVGKVEVHPGLIVVPNVARPTQLQLLEQALEFIEQEALKAGATPRDVMVNSVVEIDDTGTCELYELPTASDGLDHRG